MSPALHGAVGAQAAEVVRSPAPGSSAAWQRALEAARRLAWFHGASAAVTARDTAVPQRPSMLADISPARPLARVDSLDAAWVQSVPAQGVLGVTTGTGTGGTPSPIAQASTTSLSSPSTTLHGITGTGVGATHTQGVRPAPSADRQQAAAAVPLPASHVQATRTATGTAVRAEAVPPAERLQVPRPETQLRIHVEEAPQGLVVWLGLDAHAAAAVQAARTAALVAELRRLLANSGQRLAVVICNGTPVDGSAYPLPTPHQEP